MSGKLVVYYSRVGTTRNTAEKLAEYLKCDITEIVSIKKYGGIFGYIAAGRAGMSEKKADINEPELKPEDYDHIILCTPIWASNMAAPVRTWLNRNKEKCKKISYLVTFAAGGQQKTIAKLEKLGGKAVATVYFSDLERKSDAWLEKLAEFAKKL